MEQFYTLKEVSDKLAISPQTIRRRIDEKKLRANFIGGQLRIPESAINEYLKSTEVTGSRAYSFVPKRKYSRKSA